VLFPVLSEIAFRQNARKCQVVTPDTTPKTTKNSSYSNGLQAFVKNNSIEFKPDAI
jgi:hypothetical protein